MSTPYIGRLAPSPTGLLHLGHARTFWVAAERARAAGGRLLLRNDDLDRARCRSEFVSAMQEDLRWLGLDWDGAMLAQSTRFDRYRAALRQLHAAGALFACTRSRRDVLEAAGAPHEGGVDDEPVYPREFRPRVDTPLPPLDTPGVNWRFRVPDGEPLRFTDGAAGEQRAIAGRDFGDFIVWRRDDTPSYQLATTVDDGEFGVTEVVRGEDLIRSTFRQLLLFRALGLPAPAFFHTPLVLDAAGHRLAKRHDALALRTLREQGVSPAALREQFSRELTPLVSRPLP
ncbi:tRNA glutamyl-Q(34) synthetase GluQRS [Opitutus sp. ER46]|uniref:tRNA glutamyl-Q(34) synthetase GluQRS n=1 Tax=Opitutus sp. ER46 TaxID=2161864 RepID=UPI000D305149|nr:tRNA glutamyl-Q(34) synthetase GluQRS [Opitutus sp. ER46]PTY01111.1 tRNA glutamyl-Q(34) synthetase GluQRS [Opitutus sp. ER46]